MPRPIGVSVKASRDGMSKMERCGDSISKARLKSQSYLVRSRVRVRARVAVVPGEAEAEAEG